MRTSRLRGFRLFARRRWLTAASIGLAVAFAGALDAPLAEASSTTFCVSDASCVAGGGTSEPDLPTALSAADAAAGPTETIDLGAGTFTAPSSSGFTDSALGSNALDIVGSGEGVTMLAPHAADETVADFSGDTNASLSSLTVAMNNGGDGLIVPNHLANVAITDSGGNYAEGILGQNGTYNNITITLPENGNSTGIYRPNGTITVNGATITAGVGIGYTSPGSTDAQDDSYTDLRIFANKYGIDTSGDNGSLGTADSISESEIVMEGTNSIGVLWEQPNAYQGSFNANYLTIVGDGSAGSIGVESKAQSHSSEAQVALSNSVVYGFNNSLECTDDGGGPGNGAASLTASYSDFDPTTEVFGGSCTAITTGAGNISANPQLVTQGNGDETLAFNSPAIDAGDPSITGPLTDLAGNPRPVNGGSGSDRVDMGAFEYHRPPTAHATASPTSVAAGTPVSFSGAGSADPDSLALTYAWSFDDGGTATGASVQHTFTTAGTHHATLTVTDTLGLQSSATTTVTVTPAIVTPAIVTSAPLRLSASLHPAKFKSSAAPHDAKFHFSVSAAGTVNITLAEKKPEKKKGKSHYVTVGGTLHANAKSGANTFELAKHLAPGSYRATLVAHDSSGQASQSVTISFTVLVG